jgi:adenosylcobinamide-GDP ribazoletransferase
MSAFSTLRGFGSDFLAAVQFLTRIPVPSPTYSADSLAHSVKFFPVVGFLVGASAALVHLLLAPHWPRVVVAFLVLTYLCLITGFIHEDGLADAADGFGGGLSRDKILLIMRDSRIGSYGAAALTLSLLSRIVLLSSLPLGMVLQFLIATRVLGQWTTLPLSFYLSSARAQSEGGVDGQGARIARITSLGSLIAGTIFSFAVVIALLRARAAFAIGAAIVVSLAGGLYFQKRIGGVTGDCFGAANQIAEVAVYLCGVWIV